MWNVHTVNCGIPFAVLPLSYLRTKFIVYISILYQKSMNSDHWIFEYFGILSLPSNRNNFVRNTDIFIWEIYSFSLKKSISNDLLRVITLYILFAKYQINKLIQLNELHRNVMCTNMCVIFFTDFKHMRFQFLSE